MQRYEVEAIFEQKKDGLFEDINISSQKPIAIILGGQPACGKSTLINVAKKDHPNLDFLTVNGEWSCKSMPSIFIDESRSKQMKNKEILNTNIQRGKELIESVTNPEVKKGMKEALSQLQSSLEKVQRQEKGLKKGFF